MGMHDKHDTQPPPPPLAPQPPHVPEHTLAVVYCYRSCRVGALPHLLVPFPNGAKVTPTQKSMGMHDKHNTLSPVSFNEIR